MEDKNNIPVFGSWKGWYIAVIALHIIGIIVYFMITKTYTP